MMGGYDFGPKWMWSMGCLFAVVGFLMAIYWIIKGIIYLINNIQFV